MAKTLYYGMRTSVFCALTALISPVLAQVSTKEATGPDKTHEEILEEAESTKCLEHDIAVGMTSEALPATELIVDLANDSAYDCSRDGLFGYSAFDYHKLKEQALQIIITKCLDHQITIGMARPNFGSMASITGLSNHAAYHCSQHGTFYSFKLTDQAYQTIYSRLTPSQKEFIDKMRDRMSGDKERIQ